MKFKNFSKENVLEKMLNLGIRAELDTDFIQEVPIKHRLVYKWRRLNSFPLEFIFDEKKHLFSNVNFVKSGHGYSHCKIRVPESFENDLAYLMGAMRDGSLIYSGGKHFIRLYDTSDAIWIKNVRNIFENIFGINMYLRKQSKIDAAYLDVSSKPLYHLLNVLFSGNVHKGIPEIIKTSPRHIQKAYIEGFFDAEGHVPHKISRCRIDFTQNDRDSLEFVKNVLKNHGIKSAKISRHMLPLCGRENIENFYKEFNFLNSRKTKRIELLLKATPSG